MDKFWFEDGRTGLFDTKAGFTARDSEAKEKAEGLPKYIKDENKKGKKLRGGIVIDLNGVWTYSDKEKYEYNPNDLSNWNLLEL